MNLPEKEAGTKWCPMTRFASRERVRGEPGVAISGSYNRIGVSSSPDECRCIGSRCMLWRWEESIDRMSTLPARGHCGLGGTPR